MVERFFMLTMLVRGFASWSSAHRDPEDNPLKRAESQTRDDFRLLSH
jgi:hypothetical protein